MKRLITDGVGLALLPEKEREMEELRIKLNEIIDWINREERDRQEEIDKKELNYHDPDFEVIVTVKAVKQAKVNTSNI